jgi:hypothetical protein
MGRTSGPFWSSGWPFGGPGAQPAPHAAVPPSPEEQQQLFLSRALFTVGSAVVLALLFL